MLVLNIHSVFNRHQGYFFCNFKPLNTPFYFGRGKMTISGFVRCFIADVNYASNFGEDEGAYWFWPVRPSVYLSVRPSVTFNNSLETEEPLILES